LCDARIGMCVVLSFVVLLERSNKEWCIIEARFVGVGNGQ
jgi:hypothetical protein